MLLPSLQSIEGDGAADDKTGPSEETKDGIGDVMESTSELPCSAQTTEMYIPVPHSLLPMDDGLVSFILIHWRT